MILFFQMKMKMMKVMSAIYLCTSPKELLHASEDVMSHHNHHHDDDDHHHQNKQNMFLPP
jgi:hypothetical protein